MGWAGKMWSLTLVAAPLLIMIFIIMMGMIPPDESPLTFLTKKRAREEAAAAALPAQQHNAPAVTLLVDVAGLSPAADQAEAAAVTPPATDAAGAAAPRREHVHAHGQHQRTRPRDHLGWRDSARIGEARVNATCHNCANSLDRMGHAGECCKRGACQSLYQLSIYDGALLVAAFILVCSGRRGPGVHEHRLQAGQQAEGLVRGMLNQGLWPKPFYFTLRGLLGGARPPYRAAQPEGRLALPALLCDALPSTGMQTCGGRKQA